jgi:hypothetical protein
VKVKGPEIIIRWESQQLEVSSQRRKEHKEGGPSSPVPVPRDMTTIDIVHLPLRRQSGQWPVQ